MKLATDPTSRIDAANIVTNTGEKIQVFNIGDILKPKTVEINGQKVEYIDFTAGPHEPVHNFINSTIKQLGIESNKPALNNFVETFKSTLTDSERRVLEDRLSKMPDYVANENTLEFFNVYAEALATGEIKYPDGQDAINLLGEFNIILENASGKDFNFTTTTERAAVESIKSIISEYTRSIVNDKVDNNESVNKFLEVSYSDQGYIKINNKAEIQNYKGKAKQLQDQIKQNENLIKQLQAEGDPFGEIDAFRNTNETLQSELDGMLSNVDRAAINLENIDIIVNKKSTQGQIQAAKNKITENNAPLIQSVKNKFDYSKLDQNVDSEAAKENWDAQVDFYFSQLLNSYLNTYSRAAEAGVRPGEKFADPKKGKEYTLAEFGAYATRLKKKLTDIVDNYGEETDKFKVSIDKSTEEGFLPNEIQSALSNFDNFNIDAAEPVKTEYKPTFGNKVDYIKTSLIDISTIEFKNEKDFYTQFKNIVKGNSVELYKELTGTEETRTINKEKLKDNLSELYPDFVEFIESESDFFRLRKGVFQNFYEGIFNTDANGNITSIKRVGVAEEPQYKAKIPTQQEFVDAFTKGENRDIKRNVENLAWVLGIMNVKQYTGKTIVENNGVLNVDGKNISIINTATNPKSFAQLINLTEAYFPKESMEVLNSSRIENKAEIEGARYGDIESKAVTELAKQGIKPYMLSQVSLSVSNLDGKEREIALDTEYKVDDNRTLTGRDIQQMYLSELSDQIKAAPKETEGIVSLVTTTNQRIKAGKENEELYKDKDLTKKDFEDVNKSYNFRGKQGEANAEKREIAKPKLKKKVENPDGTFTTVVVRELSVNKDNYDAYVDRIGNFVKKLPNKEFFEGTGITLEALIGEHMRTTGMGSILIDSKTGKEISIGRIIETLSKKGIEPGQDNKYFNNIDSKILSSEYSQRTAAKKLLSNQYTKEQKDEIYKKVFTKKDAVERQKILKALLLSKFDYVWEGKTKQDVLDRYSDMAFIAKAESNNKQGQRVLASIVGAMYKDLPMEEIWVKLEHSTASVDLNTKVLDAIARGDRNAIIEISKTFEGVFGQRAQKEGSKLPEMTTTFDFYDKVQGTTYGESLKLLETLTTKDGQTVRIADEIMMENPETGNIEPITNYVIDRSKIYAKENKISDSEVAAVEKEVTSNNFMVEYRITNPKDLDKVIKYEVEKVKVNTQAAETNERVSSAEVVKETPGIVKLTENNDGATTQNQLENNVFMDKIMDTRGVQDINYNSPTFKNYNYNAETGIAKQPNNTNKFQGNRKVILMGGSAGSGKSGIAKGILKYLDSKGVNIKDFEYLNVDTEKERLVEEFDINKNQSKQADWERSLDARLMALSRADMQNQMDVTIANGKGFILDGTLASYKNTNKLIERLENEGYEVVIVKADASLETKLQRNKAREERSLRDKIVTTNHDNVESSFAKYESDGRNIIKVNTESFGKNEMPEQIAKEVYDNINENIITKIDKANLETSERSGIQNKAEINIVSEQGNQIFSNRYKLDSSRPITEAEAIKIGKDKKRKFRIMPLKARHAMPLLLEVVGKGDKKGLQHMETMLDLADQGKYNFATFKRNTFGSLKGLDKVVKDENIDLQLSEKMTDKSVFTREDAVRIYLWNKNGKEIPGLGDVSKKEAIQTVMADTDLLWYANNVEKIFKYGENEYFDPKLGWSSSSIKNDLRLFVNSQEKLFQQNFKDYFDATFTEENLNKIRAGMGNKEFDNWWSVTKDFGDRQYTGRTRAEGEKVGQRFVNWLHGSTALALFGNVKSAATQLISSTIYLGGPDNGFGSAAKAYASPEIFKAMKYIIKSDYLKDRRGSFDLALKELSDAEVGRFKGIYDKALNLSFLFSQLGDNAAITIGGAPMLLNKAKKYIREGLGEAEAYEKAMFEVAQFSESTQQSTWARNISYQQTTGLGKATLNFLSTNILYNNGALAESMKLQKGLGDAKSVRTIVNRIGVQTAMFSVLSSGIQYLYMDDDIDPDKKEKLLEKDKENILWTSMTSIINGTGITGRAATTMMGVLKKQYKFMTEEGRREADLAMELLQFSPSLSIKVKKIQQAEYDFRLAQKIYDKTGKVPTKQLLRAGTKLFSFTTNFALPEYITTIEDKYNFIMEERYTFWQKYEAALSSVYAGDPSFYKDRAKKELDEAMVDSDNFGKPVQSTQNEKGGYQSGVTIKNKRRKKPKQIGAN
jgi:predicted kinase